MIKSLPECSDHTFQAYLYFLEATAQLGLGAIEKAYISASKARYLLQTLSKTDSYSLKKLQDTETLLRFIEYKAKGAEMDLKPVELDMGVDEISSSLHETKLKSNIKSGKIVHINETAIVLSPAVQSVKSLPKCLQISLTELQKSKSSPEAQLQVLYFEIQRFKRDFPRKLAAFLKVYRQKDAFKQLAPLKRTLLSVKHASCKPDLQLELNQALSLLNAFTCIYKGNEAEAHLALESFNQSTFKLVPNLSRLVDALESLINRQEQIKSTPVTSESKKETPLPILPMPSFYDLALDFISYKPKTQSSSSGLLGRFSSFWSKK